MATLLGDTGTGHSPIYGFASDSYPIYGPYQAANTLAKPCWKKRDYASTSTTGCSDGTRSCLLVNNLDPTQGVTAASSSGPNTTTTVKTQSSNTVSSASGIYFEDYYYDSSCGAQGGEYLNEYNGHDHDNLGFHYHTTLDSSKRPVFPYIVGPKFYGCVRGGTCSTTLSVGQGSSGTTVSSACGTSSAVALASQQCTSYSFQSNFSTSDSTPGSVPTSSDSSSKGMSGATIGIIAGVVGGVLVIVLISTLWYFCVSVSAGGYDNVATNGMNINTVPTTKNGEVEMAVAVSGDHRAQF